MRATYRFLLLGLALLLGACASEAPPFVEPAQRTLAASEKPWPPGRILTLAYHEVADRDADQAFMTVRTANLVDQLAWLHEQGFQAISVDQLLAARAGRGSLPEKPLLLSFDDGYSSFYQRVLPILKAYDWPAIMAPVGVWLDTPDQQRVDFGGLAVERRRFLTRQQLAEVAKSGLVEIGAHTEALHFGGPGNPQGSQLPAAANRLYLANAGRYETEAEYRNRVGIDVKRISRTLQSITGKPPRVWVWPYGAASGTALQVVGDDGYALALTLEDGLGSIDHLDNLPRFLLNGDPDLHRFTSAISHVQAQDNLRVAHVDLDYVYDPDPRQMEANLGQLVQRIADLRINTVFLQAYADPTGDGTVKALYFPNRHLPMRADLFNRAAWQLRTRAGVEVFAWMPVLAFDLAPQLPRVQRWDPRSGRLEIDPQQYRRLSPFDPQVRRQITEIYEDLAGHAAFAGLLFHDDALLSDFEDAGPQALAAYRAAGLPGDIAGLRGDAQTLQRWTRFKSRYLVDFTRQLAERVRAIRGPQVRTARNLYALPILEPQSEAWFAQNLDDFLAAYDWTAPMAMPLMEGVPAEQSEAWLQRLVREVAKRPGALQRTVFELQARDWREGREAPVDAAQLRRWMHRLQWEGVRSFGYYPDDFVNDQPPLQALRPAISNAWYPEP
ncbi:biofilm PGA synthesis lipoprotein PgaB [Pseudomonas delhiensis]|uniref:Biofilm PGA synthesis lipoprotein PgaB n=1 Tax=Pseudomonas delhiensis TaxID=366289 RepID=A0A239L3K2_9PSED|nr:poly-beta-1,6-N-acetyl-D-glucosamine N-deacetylase PgaB [Pseudomonas delhiensis]SDK04141.1 biofilm PGA synthesis lipoprotein PgaB [Pseudomonas delhiensis]SNT24403.1 biofilm PGA synthesis lipoprotein PgaB [Pseudomonas delhiensis]